MITAGIDIGSRTIKLVTVEEGEIIFSLLADTTHDPLEQCKKLIAQVSFDKILATGYGRHFLRPNLIPQPLQRSRHLLVGQRHFSQGAEPF